MKRLAVILAALAVLAAACGHSRVTLVNLYKEADYQQHKNTLWIKVHWNYLYPDKETVVAEGFVEPFSPKSGVHAVKLELVGLDESGNVVNSAKGMPEDNVIVSPLDESRFRIEMKLNGREKGFTVRGTYYYFIAGRNPNFDSDLFDFIPLTSDESY